MLRSDMEKKPASVRMLESLFECEQSYIELTWRRDEIKRAANRIAQEATKQGTNLKLSREVNELRQ